MSYRTNEPEPEKDKEPVNYLKLTTKTFAVVLGAAMAIAILAILFMSARSSGKVDYCYLTTSSYYPTNATSTHYFVRVRGHRPWMMGDIDLWDERVELNSTVAGMERVGMAVSQFCPDGKVH